MTDREEELRCTECTNTVRRKETHDGICRPCYDELFRTWAMLDRHHDEGGRWG